VNLLGIDTSTATRAAVLRGDGQAFDGPASQAESGPHRDHAAELLPAIASRLAEAGLDYGDIDAIAVGIGPGGFTGLRIGLATAIGLARAYGAELRPISSLAALAAEGEGSLRLPLIDARRGELFGALYEEGIQRWEPFAAAPDALVSRVQTELGEEARRLVAVGNGSLRFREDLESAGLAVAAPGSMSHAVSALALCRLAVSVEPVSPEALIPLYVREPDAIATR